MQLKVKHTISGTKIIVEAGEFRLEKVYQIKTGHHEGKLIRLKHISPHAQVMIDKKRCRFISGILLENDVTINDVLENLENV